MLSPTEKGNALEAAVHAIETVILQSSPNLQESTFKIECKKIVTVHGVRHEIDVYVEVDLGNGYKSIFIFECKNWKEAVGKNELIVFSEKIKALQAQKGFFVAKSYTKDAKAQANKDPRITLLDATEHKADETPAPFDFHINEIDHSRTNVELQLLEHGEMAPPKGELVKIKKISALLRGVEIDFDDYAKKWMSEVCNKSMETFASGKLVEGMYEREAEAERVFGKGELLIKGVDVARLRLLVKFWVRLIRPAVVTHFEIANRGRVISLAPVTVGDGTIQAEFVEH